VVCYTASSDIRPDGVIDDLCRMLAPGANVVSTSFVPLLHPAHAGPGVLERLEAACQEGGTSFYTSGIDPGFGNAGITIHALALCKEVRTVRMMEIVNYATWDNPFTMFEIMGFGKADPSESLLLSPGSTALAWGPVLRPGGRMPSAHLDDVVERHEVHHRRHRHRDRLGHGGRRHHLGHALRDRRHDRRRGTRWWWSTSPASATRTPPTGRRARATGSWWRANPTSTWSVSLSSDRGDHNHAGCLATAMHVVNAIPHVVAASPGVKTYRDLPVYSAHPAR
jgi:hypothetical protein